MSIEIGIPSYLPTGYAGNWAAKAETGKSFADVVDQKTAEADKTEEDEHISRIFGSFAKHASEEVKQAFLEAEKETGGHFTVGGFWISNDGKEFQITQMAVDFFIKWYHKDPDQSDLLGTSVGSAISAVKKWIYGLDHPLAGQPAGGMEERKLIAMERAFYVSFLDKLSALGKQS